MDEKFGQVIKEFKEATKKQCYMINCVEGEPTIFDNKIGGMPYIPLNEKYPTDKKGNAMPLFLQINFQGCNLPNYPSKGIWQLFVDKDFSYPNDYTIRYYEDALDEYQKEMPVIDLKNFATNKQIKIELVPNETYMPAGDYRFNETFSDIFNGIFGTEVEDIWEIDDIVGIKNAYDVFFNELNIEFGLIGGYADFTQSDPRAFKKDPANECIVKIDSQLSDSIIIGDCGIAWVLISEEDLANRRFENAAFDWDCC